MPIKFLVLAGGGVRDFLERGGGSANFFFMGVGIFRVARQLRNSSMMFNYSQAENPPEKNPPKIKKIHLNEFI